MSRAMMSRLSILVLPLLLCGCVGVHTYQLSGSEPDITATELSQAIEGKSATVTLLNGTLYRGTAAMLQADSMSVCLEETDSMLSIPNGLVYSVSTAGGELAVPGGVLGGLIAGAIATSKDTGERGGFDQMGENVGKAFVIVAGGAAIGGTLIGNLHPPRRYVFASLPGGRDTIRVNKDDIVSSTNKQLTVREKGRLVTYSKEIVQAISEREQVLIVRPAK